MRRLGLSIATLLVVPLAVGCGAPTRDQRRDETEARGPELGARMEIPGTGVSLRPPFGAKLLDLGPGLEVEEREIAVLLALVDGRAEARRALRDSLTIAEDGTRGTTRVDVGPATGTLGRDVMRVPGGSTPRVFLVAEHGSRLMVLVATYPEGAAAAGEELEASFATVRWEANATIDPATAIGVSLGPVEGLEIDRGTVGTLALTPRDVPFPPPPTDPSVFLLPLMVDAPDEEDQARCSQVLGEVQRLNQVPDVSPLELDDGWGCEAAGLRTSDDGVTQHAYGAVLFTPYGPFVILGTCTVDSVDTWQPRFEAVARTLRYVRDAE